MGSKETVSIALPGRLSFTYSGVNDFDRFLRLFNWSLENVPVEIDFRQCKNANYQALSLFVLYIWHLRKKGCQVAFLYGERESNSATTMWYHMGAQGIFHVLNDEGENFHGKPHKPLLAIRNFNEDFRTALEKAENYTSALDIEYEKTLRYILSELLYNTLEHGKSWQHIPSLLQFNWYQKRHELSFVIADLGVGIKKHLSQSYSGLGGDVEAILLALKPQVSGTFNGSGQMYAAKNNAGVGLYFSSNIVKRLHANMYMVSGNGLVHVSPTEVTHKELRSSWPGTFVYVTLRLGTIPDLNLQKIMAEFREAATTELARANSNEQKNIFYFNVRNYFGRYAEDKQLAIKLRDEKILLAIEEGKSITVDFEEVISAPHSLLNALLATPIQRLGLAAYKKIKVINASPEIRETVDFIMDENTSLA
ncbi:MAG: STAS-like domain-containing protein [Pyrinomonadaceae bacterium]